MDAPIEMNLSQAVNVTNTSFIRSALRERIERDGLSTVPVELVRFHVFIHCTGGSGRHMVDFEDHEVTRGTALWIRPGQVQRWSDVDARFDADVAVFESSSIPDLPLFNRLLGATAIANIGPDTDRLEQQMAWMASDLATSQDQAMAAAVVGVLLRLFARHADGGDQQALTAAGQLAASFIESVESDLEQRSVAWHAQRIGASTRTVARATAEALGQRPKAVIDERVLLEAQRRLAWSGDDISAIAKALRFSEASNFTKFFRSRTGISPSAFRSAITTM